MAVKVGIIVYAYVLAEPLAALLEHILDQDIRPHIYLALHSQTPEVIKICEHYSRHPRVHYYPYGVNRGLARSANELFYLGYYVDQMDVMMTANDDIQPQHNDIRAIAVAAYYNRDKWIVEGMGTIKGEKGRVEWALAAVNPIAFETIGYFDENFFPAYYEDVDYRYRAKLAGLEGLTVEDTNINHFGSMSLRLLPPVPFIDAFQRNQSYYQRKWAGDVGHEMFTRPFNDPALGLKIEYQDRHAPYAEYDRDDMKAAETL